MRILAIAVVCALVLLAPASQAQTNGQLPGLTPEVGLLTEDHEATVLNKGGKFAVLQGFKHIPEGATCKVYKSQLVWKHTEQTEAAEGETVVRIATVAQKEGDCPLGTRFTIKTIKYEAARDAFAAAWTDKK